MLRAVDEPVSFVILLLAFVAAVTLQGWITAQLALRSGQRSLRAEGRTLPDPRRHLDPFAAVAVVLGGLGWATPTEVPRRSAAQTAVVVLTAPLVLMAVGLGLLVAYGDPFSGFSVFLREGIPTEALSAGKQALLLPGMVFLYVGALSVLPLPPLPGGQVLFAAAPRTLGWQKAEHQLVERNIGTVVLLALVLISLGGPDPILPNVLDGILSPLIEAVTGA